MTTYVSATNNRSVANGATTISDSFSHTFSSDANRCAVVLLFFGDQSGQSAASVTIGGVAATFLVAGTSSGAVGHRSEMWYLVNPSSGSQTIEVTLNSNAGYEWWQTCVELSDCAGPRSGSEINEGGTSAPNPQTISVTSAAGDIVIDALATNGTVLGTAGGSQTLIRSTNSSDVQQASYADGAASVDMTWTGLAATDFGHVAASFQSPSSDEATVTPTQATLTTQGRAPLVNDFATITLRGTMINEAGSPLADLTGIACLVWYGEAPVGAPDESLSSLTTNSNGSYSFALALGGLAFNDPVYRVIYLGDPPTRNHAGRRVPDYE